MSCVIACRCAYDHLNEGRRDVFSAFVDGLTAGAYYALVIEVAGKNVSSLSHWRFRTAPAHSDDVELVFGGDMGIGFANSVF